MAKKISILGSTGSIGTQTLDVCKHLGIEVLALSANTRIDILEEQIREYKPRFVAVVDTEAGELLKKKLGNFNVGILTGQDAFCDVAACNDADTVVTSLVGVAGLVPTIVAIDSGKDIALANKETLVSAGRLVMNHAKNKNINIFPVDSEHSAIFQCLSPFERAVEKIILTASGGPHLGRDRAYLKTVSVEDTLKHPNWSMGKKITVDSATLMNKGLEVIEARWLFDVEASRIKVVVHPQSIIHSMVEYQDGSIIAQLGEPDMRIPIQYALTYPKRMSNEYPKLDFSKRCSLTFQEPDMDTFACLGLAYKALDIGGLMPAVLNAANESAVALFLNGKISLLDIPRLIDEAMTAYNIPDRVNNMRHEDYTLDTLLEVDAWARKYVDEVSGV